LTVPGQDALDLAQLADALAYTHAKGICHRDLKPSNVLFAAGGKPMLLDFNLAQDEQAVGRRLGGTLPYMAPEQLNSIVLEPEAGPPSIDPRSDLFSLAVIGYELLCGVWPYGTILPELTQDEFAIELFERQRSGPVALIERDPQVGADVSALFQRCLSFDADARPQTAAELAAQLRQCLSPWRRAKRWARRRRKLVACAATAILSLTAWAGYFVATLPPYGERELRKATAALDRRDLTAAMGHLNEAAAYLPPERNSALADACFRAGQAAYDAKEYGLADNQLKNAIDRGLNSKEVWFYRGAACYRQGDWGLANSYFLKAYEIKPAAHLSACMGDSVLQDGDQVLAMAEYQGAIRDGYETLAVLNNLGSAYLMGGKDFEQAESCFARAIEKAAASETPSKASALVALYYNRALIEFRRAENQQRMCSELSKQEIQKAVSLAPDRCLPRLLAADVYGLHAAEGDAGRRLAVDYMQDAIRLGAPASLTNKSQLLRELVAAVRDRPGGDALLAAQQQELTEPLPNRLHVLDDLLR